MPVTATFDDVLAAVRVGRLRIDPAEGQAYYRRGLQDGATWRRLGGGLRRGPHQALPYVYWTFALGGQYYGILAHRAVWYVARGPIAPKLTVNHLDGDKRNNRINNLELVTMSENLRHAHAIGLFPPGFGTNTRSLTVEQVRDIRARLTAGERVCDIAAAIGITANIVSRISRGHTYVGV